ncbi:MAG: Coenzyme F420 hydrogenase/dehydrogenase, beta subunit C-terminal domain [candidate division WOR-3 bacterium]
MPGWIWERRLFEPEACRFCDDVFAAAAEVVLMDAWLERYVRDPGGWNLALVRSLRLDKLLRAGARKGELVLEPISVNDIIKSQEGVMQRKRRELAERLALERRGTTGMCRAQPIRISLLRAAQLRAEAQVQAMSRTVYARCRDRQELNSAPGEIVSRFEKGMRLAVLQLKVVNYFCSLLRRTMLFLTGARDVVPGALRVKQEASSVARGCCR